MRSILFYIILCYSNFIFSQNIISGPAVGGVQSMSARIFIKTNTPQSFQLELSENANFNAIISFNDSTRFDLFSSVITEVNQLKAFTKYYYRYRFNGVLDSLVGSFKTFPDDNDRSKVLKIVVGSCNYSPNPTLFQSIRDFDPDFFIHLGDWGFNPSAPGFGADYNLFPEKRAAAFPYKFNDEMMKQYVLPFSGIDYIYDDDYSQNDVEGQFFSSDQTTTDSLGNAVTTITIDTLPQGINEGAIEAYQKYFPGYSLADSSEGIFHSIRMGNVEIFMTDVRLPRDPRINAFFFDTASNFWTFAPSSQHTILGEKQRLWLVDALQNSTADWKILGSGLVFNQNYRRIIDFGMLAQRLNVNIAGRQGSGMTLAYTIAVNWAGYPTDLNAVLDLKNNGLKNLIAISGDTHSSVIDDGANAGIPELNASGLAAGDEAFLNFFIDSVLQSIGSQSIKDILWNVGGNGIDNRNFTDSYGTLEIFGEDSIRMCVVDELNFKLACLTVPNEKITSTSALKWKSESVMTLIFPNPAKDKIQIVLENDARISPDDQIHFMDMSGKILKSWNMDSSQNKLVFDVDSYAPGNYMLLYEGKKIKETKNVVLNP